MKELSLSQAALAGALGVKQASVWGWLKGQSKPKNIIGLAEVLQTTPQWLLTGEDSKPSVDDHSYYETPEFTFILTYALVHGREKYPEVPVERVIKIAQSVYKKFRDQSEGAKKSGVEALFEFEGKAAN